MPKLDKAARAAAKHEREARAEADRKTALGQVETIGKQISSLVDKINREEDAAIDAYNKHAGESTTLREHLAEKLKEAEPICKAAGMTAKEMKARYIGDRLGNTQFKQLLRVARGAITFQQIKENESAKKRRQAEAKKVGNSRPSEPQPQEQPRVTGPAEISTEQRQAEMAKLAGEVPPIAPAAPEPGIPEPPADNDPPEGMGNAPLRTLTPEELSDDALTAFKEACAKHCPIMNAADLKAARVYLNGHDGAGKGTWAPRVVKKAA